MWLLNGRLMRLSADTRKKVSSTLYHSILNNHCQIDVYLISVNLDQTLA